MSLRDLPPGHDEAYEVHLDGERAWPPEQGWDFPPSRIRVPADHETIELAFGSCRVAAPHQPPYVLTKDQDPEGREVDALWALAHRMRDSPPASWPDALILLGDQVYADEVSVATTRSIAARRPLDQPPGTEVADFEEYTWLYREAWSDPAIRWLLSTLSSAMIFDDHDVHDDWNTSQAWVDEMRAKPWWSQRIVGAYASYWIYQHLGNLSARGREADALWAAVHDHDGDAGPLVRAFARRAEQEVAGSRWSYARDFGRTRLLVLDSRAGRMLGKGERAMLSPAEWDWAREQATGDFDHLVITTSLPYLLAPGMHHLEAWNEAVCDGAWGKAAAGLGEKLRQGLDLEHWSAFEACFARMAELIAEVGSGRRGPAPASIVLLSGDVHHAYVAEAGFPAAAGVRSAVVQAVCSPVRNPLDARERRVLRTAMSRPAAWAGRALARSAGVAAPPLRWRLPEKATFDNQVASLLLDGRSARVRIEKTDPGDWPQPRLHVTLDRRLCHAEPAR